MTQMNKKQKGVRTNKPTTGMIEGSHQYVDQRIRTGNQIAKVN